MCAGTREDGSVIEANDPQWATLQDTAKAAAKQPQAWLEQPTIYGDIANDGTFSAAFTRWLAHIWQYGASHALASYVGKA